MAQAAERLRQTGRFGDVLEGYWKGEPSLRQVLRLTHSSDVTVIPFFLMAGYLTETVLPRELGLGFQGTVPPGGVARVLGGRSVRYLPPPGTHPALTETVLAVLERYGLTAQERPGTALILVGQAGEAHVTSLRPHFAEVHLVSPQTPLAADWWAGVGGTRQVILPFVQGKDWKTRLGAPEAVSEVPPLGLAPELADVILTMLDETEIHADGDAERSSQEAWTTLEGRIQPALRVGEVLVTATHGVYEVRHMLDEGRATAELQTVVTPEGLREMTALDDAGHFRPLRTRRDLPRGWRAVLSAEDLPLGLHLLYPSAAEDAYAHSQHALRYTPWPSTARRQTGSFAKVQRANDDQVTQAVRQVCSGCLRTPLWAGQTLSQTFLSGVPGGIPCAEACMYLLTEVRDSL